MFCGVLGKLTDTSVQQMCNQRLGIVCQPIDTTTFRNLRRVNYRPCCFSCVTRMRLVMRHYFIAAWKSGQVNTFYYLDFYVMDALLVVNCTYLLHVRGARAIVDSRLSLKCDGTRAETRFRLSAKRTSPFKSAGASVQSTTGSRGVRISGSNAGCTMFRGSVKGTGYTLHSPVSPSLPLPCVTVCHHISAGFYCRKKRFEN